MNQKKKIICGIGVALLVAGAFLSGHYAGAASKTPGTTGDPLITLSYLEGRLAETGGYAEKVQLKKGQRLLGEPGSGVIVLGGSVIADGSGLIDVTQGGLVEKDTSLFAYHSYMISEKGSGCEALSACTLFVLGNYTID